jgi:hypothetical protein
MFCHKTLLIPRRFPARVSYTSRACEYGQEKGPSIPGRRRLLSEQSPVEEVVIQQGAQHSEFGAKTFLFPVKRAAWRKTYGLTLVTNNTRHFENISGLSLADWSVPEGFKPKE